MLIRIPNLHSPAGDTIDIMSTSSVTADTTPIQLSVSDYTRIRFLPKLVQNPNEAKKSVCGKLCYEKKPKNESYFPCDTVPPPLSSKVSRRSCKVGDWMEIELDTSETYELYLGLKKLYELYEDMGGIPYGYATYTRIDSSFKDFLSIIQNDPSAARLIGNEDNYELVKILLRLITQAESHESLKKSLSELQNDNLQQLTSSLSIERLQRVATLMQENLDNDDEEFWQTTVFKENQWILAQIFSSPCTICGEKTYVGGKGLDNKGGNICDFIYQNQLSQNVALIEIKTPCTAIIGQKYRGTFSLSGELSGAINQVLNYKDKLTKEYYYIDRNSSKSFEVFNPKCVVVIGKISLLADTDQIGAFENFRNSLNNVTIITFDELYQKIIDLMEILSSCENQQDAQDAPIADSDIDDEFPF